MKEQDTPKKSVKEQELANFFQRKLLSGSGAIVTDQLDIIKEWVTRHNGKPVKAIYTNKKQVTIELNELNFGEQLHPFYKEITWEHWYEIFKTQQFQFLFIPAAESGKQLSYKLSK